MGMLNKIFIFCKKNWQLFLIILIVLIAYKLFSQQTIGFATRLDELNKIQTTEIKKINDANQQLQKRLEENEKSFNDRITEIDKKYKLDTQNLLKKQAQIQKATITEYEQDPKKLEADVEHLFGIKVIK